MLYGKAFLYYKIMKTSPVTQREVTTDLLLRWCINDRLELQCCNCMRYANRSRSVFFILKVTPSDYIIGQANLMFTKHYDSFQT